MTENRNLPKLPPPLEALYAYLVEWTTGAGHTYGCDWRLERTLDGISFQIVVEPMVIDGQCVSEPEPEPASVGWDLDRDGRVTAMREAVRALPWSFKDPESAPTAPQTAPQAGD